MTFDLIDLQKLLNLSNDIIPIDYSFFTFMVLLCLFMELDSTHSYSYRIYLKLTSGLEWHEGN